jgi:hypothetical protein
MGNIRKVWKQMGVTDRLEKIMENLIDKIGDAFSGGKIHPLEIAKKSLLELKRNQTVSVSQTYIPNIYQVILNTEDRTELSLYEDAIIPEIKEYLMNYIKKENLSLMGELEIELVEQGEMEKGKFEIKSLIKKGKKTEPGLEKTLVREHPIIASMGIKIKEGPDKGKTFPLSDGDNVIGRKEDNQIKLSDPEISRTHSLIIIINHQPWLEDMGSTNGTYLNGKKVTERIKLQNGDLISLGNTVVEFSLKQDG